jgi:hypothetical protein
MQEAQRNTDPTDPKHWSQIRLTVEMANIGAVGLVVVEVLDSAGPPFLETYR